MLDKQAFAPYNLTYILFKVFCYETESLYY